MKIIIKIMKIIMNKHNENKINIIQIISNIMKIIINIMKIIINVMKIINIMKIIINIMKITTNIIKIITHIMKIITKTIIMIGTAQHQKRFYTLYGIIVTNGMPIHYLT